LAGGIAGASNPRQTAQGGILRMGMTKNAYFQEANPYIDRRKCDGYGMNTTMLKIAHVMTK
jgi:hypothetical protein